MFLTARVDIKYTVQLMFMKYYFVNSCYFVLLVIAY